MTTQQKLTEREAIDYLAIHGGKMPTESMDEAFDRVLGYHDGWAADVQLLDEQLETDDESSDTEPGYYADVFSSMRPMLSPLPGDHYWTVDVAADEWDDEEDMWNEVTQFTVGKFLRHAEATQVAQSAGGTPVGGFQDSLPDGFEFETNDESNYSWEDKVADEWSSEYVDVHEWVWLAAGYGTLVDTTRVYG